MSVFNKVNFIRNEIKDLPDIDKKVTGGIGSFCSKIGYAISLSLKEKEIFFFAFLQWVAIAIGYLLWVQMLDWIPQETWRAAANNEDVSAADLILLAWSFICVGIAAFPIGILTGCMGATHFLHKQGQQSTIAQCLKLVLPHSWSLWSFHWLDGWITVNQIVKRLPSEDNRTNSLLSEALYYAWKLGISGVLPCILTGCNLISAARNSVFFVKANFADVAKLRAGYSALCWIVGIGAYIGTILFFMVSDIVPGQDEIYGNIYSFYLWAAVPILVAAAIVMLILRPIYVIALCDIYSDYLDEKNIEVDLPEEPTKSTSTFVVFGLTCFIVAVVYIYRGALGI